MEKSLNEKRAEFDGEQRIIEDALSNEGNADTERKSIL
jgi:hypothetical protein